MWRKLFFLTSFVLVLALSGAVQAATDIDVNNYSFEYDSDGNQIDGHQDLGPPWEQGGASGFAGVDTFCPQATGACHNWPASDGYCYPFIQNVGTAIFQVLDPCDANAVITEGRRYTLTFDSLAEDNDKIGQCCYGNPVIEGSLFYVVDPCLPNYEPNHIQLTSRTFALEKLERDIGDCSAPTGLDPYICRDWNYNFKVVFVAEASQAYLGGFLGIKFIAPPDDGDSWNFVDNVRLEWQWASQAYSPNPDDGAVEVSKDADLSWSPGLWAKDVNGHDVYFGSTWAEVNSATTASAEFKGNQDANLYDPGTMILGDTYYWRIDEVNENYTYPSHGPVPTPPNGRWKGVIWSFTVAGRAKNPHPEDGASDVPKNVLLRWTRGAESLYHDVYFGTDESAVTAATTSDANLYKTRLNKGTEEYDAEALVTVGEQYFWRIDEVNSITVKGNIWDFTVANWMLVDDFDFYATPTDLRVVWKDYYTGHAEGVVLVNKDANFAVDGNSMTLQYWNTAGVLYSEAMRTYSSGQDWSYSGNGVTLLEIDWFGDMNSAPDPPMYVKLSDDTNSWQVNPGPNDVTDESQHTWQIPLKDFSGVTLSSITSIILGIGDGAKEGGPPAENGTLYFDNIKLYPPRCFPEYKPTADFTGDCRVDVNDLRTVVRDWCNIGHWGLPVPVIEYLFEEGSGTTVANTGAFGSDYDLTIGLGWDTTSGRNPTMEPNNDPCWVSDADPCRGWTLWFDGELGLHPTADPPRNGADYLVIPPMNLNSNTVTITAWIKPDPNYWDASKSEWKQEQRDGFTGLVHSRDIDESVTTAGMSYGSGGGFVYDGSMGYVWNGNASNTWSFESGIWIPDQEWSFTAVVVEPTQATLYLYDTNGTSDPCDDVLYQKSNVLTHFQQEFGGDTFIAGDGGGSASRFYRGQMDAVRIYGFSLTQAQLEDVIDDIPLTGIMYFPLSSFADLCVGNKSPTDPNAPIDDQLDFCDWSKFADEWHMETLWPLP